LTILYIPYILRSSRTHHIGSSALETIIWFILTFLVQLSGGSPTGGAAASTDMYFSEYSIDYTAPICPVGTLECRATLIINHEFGTVELYIGK